VRIPYRLAGTRLLAQYAALACLTGGVLLAGRQG
jgi:hypothetical protein